MDADLRIPVTAEQKRLIAEAVEDAPNGFAPWAREILVQAASHRIAKRQGGDGDGNPQDRRTRDLLQEVYRLSDLEMVHGAGDLIFDFVQESLRNCDFAAVDYLLEAVDASRLKPALMITFLSITVTAKQSLAARERYFHRVLDVVSRARGPEKAAQLLEKYK